MISKSVDFERFLEVCYPDAYLRISSENVKDDVYSAIFSEYEIRFKKWQAVPQWIKDFYKDVLPSDVMNGNITIDDFIENVEYVCLISPDRDFSKIRANNFRDVVYIEESQRDEYQEKVELGYSSEHARKLIENKHTRDCLCHLCRPLTTEERKIWRKSRKNDRHIILESYKKDQPHKMVYHSIRQYDMCIRKMREEKSAKKKIEYLLKATKHKYEIMKYLPKVENKKLKRVLMRMYIVAKKELGFKKMREEQRKIAKYVVVRPPKKKVNKKAMAEMLNQVSASNEM